MPLCYDGLDCISERYNLVYISTAHQTATFKNYHTVIATPTYNSKTNIQTFLEIAKIAVLHLLLYATYFVAGSTLETEIFSSSEEHFSYLNDWGSIWQRIAPP